MNLASIQPSKSSQRHVVLLDDDVRALRGLARTVANAGHRVTATTDPKQAMEVVVCEHADAIVTDLHMPQMSGNLVLAMLSQAAPNAARLLLTSDTDFGQVAAMIAPYSVHAFVAKQDASSRLVTTLQELFTAHEQIDEAQRGEEARTMARSIVRALALRDYETEAHCERVAAWAKRLATEMGLSPSRVTDVELGSLLHDVGKIGVRDAILLKPGPLTADEWIEMKRHPDLGVALLADVPGLRRATAVVQNHHERRDGKGYPRGLGGDEVPIDARIFQVVDAYDAIVSDRPYRKGRSDAEAREEIANHVGPQFDPQVFEAFMRIPAPDWIRVTAAIRR